VNVYRHTNIPCRAKRELRQRKMKFLRRVPGHMFGDEIGNRSISNELQIFDIERGSQPEKKARET